VVPVEGVYDLHRKLQRPKRLASSAGAGHVHFGDNPEVEHESFRAACASNDYPVGGEHSIDFPASRPPRRRFRSSVRPNTAKPCQRTLPRPYGRPPQGAACGRDYLNGDLEGLFAARVSIWRSIRQFQALVAVGLPIRGEIFLISFGEELARARPAKLM
jgi:hypothetical protein